MSLLYREKSIFIHHLFKSGMVLAIVIALFLSEAGMSRSIQLMKENVLLLNSGLTDAQEAELKIVLWFERGKPAENLLADLPADGWEWQEAQLGIGENNAYTLAGRKSINAQEEKSIYPWFAKLSQEVQELGGIAYLDERVPEGIDIAKFSIEQEINPVQWSFTESTISVAGLKSGFYPAVQSGDEAVNIQLISQAHDGQGRTALAIPVLLEEF